MYLFSDFFSMDENMDDKKFAQIRYMRKQFTSSIYHLEIKN